MRPRPFDIVKNYLAIVARITQSVHHLDMLAHSFAEGRLYDADMTVEQAIGVIRTALIRKELEAWRQIGLMALTTTDAQQKEIRALAYKRFYGDHMAVMHLTDWNGEIPGNWSGTDETELRQMLEESFNDK